MGCKQNAYKHNITCYSHRLIWFEKNSRLRDIQKPEDALITAKIPETDFPLPKLGTADLHGPVGLDEHGLEPRGLVRWNGCVARWPLASASWLAMKASTTMIASAQGTCSVGRAPKLARWASSAATSCSRETMTV